MSLFKFFIPVSIVFLLSGCSELLYCQNPSRVALLDRLPCANCDYKGTVRPDYCPDATYPHKLQCAAEWRGANVVLLHPVNRHGYLNYPVYACPPLPSHDVPKNTKTDVSNSCSC